MKMKEIRRFLSHRYTQVDSDDNKESNNNYNRNKFKGQQQLQQQQQQLQQQQQQQQQQYNNNNSNDNNNNTNNSKYNSLKTNKRSYDYPAKILNSFFNVRQYDEQARYPKCSFLLLAVGILTICIAVLFKVLRPYDLIFNYKLTFQKDSEMFKLWEKPPIDLYIKVYLFNITNAEAFLAGREKINVAQVGPYVYKELMTHENVTFNDNNTMSTKPSHPLVWQEHLSEGNKEDDQVVMLNIAMLAIGDFTANRNLIVRLSISSLFTTLQTAPIVRMTAKEFMFGYATKLTSLGNTFLPGWIHFDKVGLIDRMYDFSKDYETFYTGERDPSISGLYATYMGKSNLPQWPQEHCSNIELASDGSKFRSFLKPNDTLKFFRKSMCRPIKLKKSEDELIKVGRLQGYKYYFEENAFDNGRYNEANKCFCRHGYCQPLGLLDVTDCYYGFPISLSLPHFMDGDPDLQTNVTGLKPNKEQHKSEFIVEPDAGVPLSLSVKIQINMHFKNLAVYRHLQRFSYLTIPMLWFDVTMPKLSSELDLLFHIYLNVLPYIEPIGFWLCLIIGCSLLSYTIIRATIRMSYLTQLTSISSSKHQYGKGNNLSNNIDNSVYKPCEMKLLKSDAEAKYMLNTNDICRNDDDMKELYTPQLTDLDLEPALSISDCSQMTNSGDEGSECDTAIINLSQIKSTNYNNII